MRIILDTDVLSNTHKLKPHPNLVQWLISTPADTLVTTAITVAELQIGVDRLKASNSPSAGPAMKWLYEAVLPSLPIIPFTGEAALVLARMRETPALHDLVVVNPRSKKSVPGADLMIAATSIAAGAAIATHNVRHFMRINDHFELPGLYDPFEMKWHAKAEWQMSLPLDAAQ
ncbi:MAG: PIN domain-containing protein [Ferrovibrio sp.]|uniref:PIN domain-containing protein n=1 Tax=Ferrovibrio sp. TaxID=1917215 RepID=UPI00260DC965|nr:PIN domain-containing protein [Ferrovibrio sp.]MCW0236308.1 PIN domain-containing protein [Ferrovibrio sp.]